MKIMKIIIANFLIYMGYKLVYYGAILYGYPEVANQLKPTIDRLRNL